MANTTGFTLGEPHTIPTNECQGLLVEPREKYGDTCYWHGHGAPGRFSKPRDQYTDAEHAAIIEAK